MHNKVIHLTLYWSLVCENFYPWNHILSVSLDSVLRQAFAFFLGAYALFTGPTSTENTKKKRKKKQ